MNKTKNINRIASRFAYKFGKLFLIMGAVFAVTEITNAQAQVIVIKSRCTNYDSWACAKWEHGRGEDSDWCSSWGICYSSENYITMDQIKPYILIPSANTIISNASASTFKAKMLSAIPDADQQFKAKIMTLLPSSKIAEMYDPNFVYQ